MGFRKPPGIYLAFPLSENVSDVLLDGGALSALLPLTQLLRRLVAYGMANPQLHLWTLTFRMVPDATGTGCVQRPHVTQKCCVTSKSLGTPALMSQHVSM